jgi:hypothetical protein
LREKTQIQIDPPPSFRALNLLNGPDRKIPFCDRAVSAQNHVRDVTRTAFDAWIDGRFINFGELLSDERWIQT